MRATLLRTSTLLAISFCTLPGISQAQTPVPAAKPSIALKWLGPLTVQPTTGRAGAELTGTVNLLRPTIGEIKVDRLLSPAMLQVEGFAPGHSAWVGNSAMLDARPLIFAKGQTQQTFKITTFPPRSGASITYTVSAIYGNERVSATFTVNP
jgi:hypothetical protein